MANPADTKFNIIRETVEGTTPTTPAFTSLEYSSGNDLKVDSKTISSEVMRQSRTATGHRKVGKKTTGSFKFPLRRDTATDLLLESVCSGTFVSDVLKGGNTDTFHTIEKQMKEGATTLYFAYAGQIATKFGLSVTPDGFADVTFETTGLAKTQRTAIITGATYAAATQGPLLAGPDITVSIAGLTADYASFDFSIDQSRDAKLKLGAVSAFGTGTVTNRAVKFTAKIFRKDLSPETTFTADTPVNIVITMGSAGNGYSITIPAAVCTVDPTDEVSSASALVSLEFTAANDTTTGTDVIITRL
ncbi:MAG: hypothetical protein E7773_10215 [Sphingomonas sp.]|uniref:phage tail tube protein n=1 Tax=Sphingomonas sp. TaxID=28214 RepID=UPI00122709F8|nr:phage tail tube protein [Sphingomonas sp.]THD35712.1 MAG: hypothetical protein E7773_10215 [Sphingomonas sp.]